MVSNICGDSKMNEKHVLGLSGGKDSTALAIYMREKHPDLDIEYFFADTGKELPEVYEYLVELEAILGKSILRLNAEKNFDWWLNRFNGFLPSPRARWCTHRLKIKPFYEWLDPFMDKGYHVYSYVAIRSDEASREGMWPGPSLTIKFPFKEAGIDKAGVLKILEDSGLGLPKYYSWRTRSGCTFCFFQQKIEWVGLLENHPGLFKKAMAYEKTEGDKQFTWNQRESLAELSRPERVAEIKARHEKRVARIRERERQMGLPFDGPVDMDEVHGQIAPPCLTCHK